MQANYVSLDLIEKLEKDESTEGFISTVYPNLFTVITEQNELVYFLNNKKYIAPMSVILEDLCSFEDLNLTRDTKVIFEKSNITIDSHKIEIGLDCAETWDPKVELLFRETSEDLLDNNLLMIEQGILKHGKYEGFAPIIYNIGEYIDELKTISNLKIHNNLYSSFISEKIIEFVFDIVNNDLEHISQTTNEFIGFGPGLTPSSDDFLCGFMISLIYMGSYYELDLDKIYNFNSLLLADLVLDKEDMSHNLMMQYSRGYAQKMIKQFINNMMYEKDREEMNQSMRETISFGDISGTDILCGIYIGTRLIRNENIKKQFRK